MTNRKENLRTVGEVAQLLGLSVRTLHHWEARGLVSPTKRTWSNYRLYDEGDIARLQQIMVYRGAGLRLDTISSLLDQDADPVNHLRRQRELLAEKRTELQEMLQAVDELLEDAMKNKKLSVEEVAEILGDASFPAHQAEAEETWGDTDDWKVSAERTANMTRADWEQSKAEAARVEGALVDAMDRGVQPGSPEANALAEEHRAMLSTYFPVTHAKHVLISCGYVSDPRFNEHYETRGTGLAAWLKEIIDANALAHGVDPQTAVWE